jgi:hypothetical protein
LKSIPNGRQLTQNLRARPTLAPRPTSKFLLGGRKFWIL